MKAFKAAFINEVEKIYRKRKVVVAAILSILAIVMGQLVVTGINRVLIDSCQQYTVSDPGAVFVG